MKRIPRRKKAVNKPGIIPPIYNELVSAVRKHWDKIKKNPDAQEHFNLVKNEIEIPEGLNLLPADYDEAVNEIRREQSKKASLKKEAKDESISPMEIAASLRELANKIENQYNASLKMNRFQG